MPVVLILIGLIFCFAMFWVNTSGGNEEEVSFPGPQTQFGIDDSARTEFTRFEEWTLPLWGYHCTEGENSLHRAMKWIKASGDPDIEVNLTADDLIFQDLMVLIREVTLAKDVIRLSDAQFLVEASHLLHLPQVQGLTPQNALNAIERYRCAGDLQRWLVPNLLALRGDPDLPRVVRIYLNLARRIAKDPNPVIRQRRRVGLDLVRKELKTFLLSHSQPQTAKDNTDPRCELLDLPSVYTAEEMRNAYHRAAALWHPDKLAHLAPELRSHAEVQMKAINEAYQSLQAELGGNSI